MQYSSPTKTDINERAALSGLMISVFQCHPRQELTVGSIWLQWQERTCVGKFDSCTVQVLGSCLPAVRRDKIATILKQQYQLQAQRDGRS